MLYTWTFIWQPHNKMVYEERQFTFHHYLTSLTGWLQIIFTITTGHTGHFVVDISMFRGLGVQDRSRCAPFTISINWLLHQVRWVKLNSDGIAQSALSRVVVRGVYRDHMGRHWNLLFDVGVGMVMSKLDKRTNPVLLDWFC